MPEELSPEQKEQLAAEEAQKAPPEFASFEQFLAAEKAKEPTEEERGLQSAAPEKKPDPKPDKKAKAAAEAEVVTDLMAQRLGFRRKKKEEPEVTKERGLQSASPEDESAAAAAAAEAAADKKKVKVTRREPAPDPAEIAATAAESAARTIQQAMAHLKPAPAAKADPLAGIEEGLTEEEKQEYQVFQQMAADNPAQKELPKKYLRMIAKIDDYQAKWEAANPGKVFDKEEEDHNEFYATITPEYSDREFRRAEARLVAEELLQKDRAASQQRDEEIQGKLTARDLLPVIQQTKLAAAREIVRGLGQDYDKLIEEKGYDEFMQADPLAAHILSQAAHAVGSFIETARQIDSEGSTIKWDLKKPAHLEYLEYLLAQEQELKAGPAKDRLREGKRFATRQELAGMAPSQRKGYWFLDDNELIGRKVAEQAAAAAATYQAEAELADKIAVSRGYKKDTATQKTQTTQKPAAPKPAASAAGTRSVESAGSNRVDTSGQADPNAAPDVMDLVHKALFLR